MLPIEAIEKIDKALERSFRSNSAPVIELVKAQT